MRILILCIPSIYTTYRHSQEQEGVWNVTPAGRQSDDQAQLNHTDSGGVISCRLRPFRRAAREIASPGGGAEGKRRLEGSGPQAEGRSGACQRTDQAGSVEGA